MVCLPLLAADCLDAVSAFAQIAGVAITFLAVIVALFGEQWRKHLMRPHLSVSCGTKGFYFHPSRDLYGVWEIYLSVMNQGKSSAKSVRCVLQSMRHWDGTRWVPTDSFFPTLLEWRLDNDHTLQTLPPNSSSWLTFAFFDNQPNSIYSPELKLKLSDGVAYSGGRRYQFELVIHSDDDLHYHGLIETSWAGQADGDNSSFTININHQT